MSGNLKQKHNFRNENGHKSLGQSLLNMITPGTGRFSNICRNLLYFQTNDSIVFQIINNTHHFLNCVV